MKIHNVILSTAMIWNCERALMDTGMIFEAYQQLELTLALTLTIQHDIWCSGTFFSQLSKAVPQNYTKTCNFATKP